jgi:hypothetical protein
VSLSPDRRRDALEAGHEEEVAWEKVTVMNRPQLLAQRIAALLAKRNAAYCEACLIERLLVASRAAMKAALEQDCFSVRVGVCADCKTRKQVVTNRAGRMAA